MPKKTWTRYEKTWLILLVAALSILIVKSFMLDSLAPSNPEIETFREETIEALEAPPLKIIRLIKIEEITSDGKPAIKGIFRKYLFGVMPYGDYVAIKTKN
jgi:hypothetical protein